MKKYILALRHFIPHLIAVGAITVVALFFPLTVIGTILITAFFTLLLPYMEKVKEIERQLEVGRKVPGDSDVSRSNTMGSAPRSLNRVQRRSAAKSSEAFGTKGSGAEPQAVRISFVTKSLKALAFVLGGLTVVGVVGYTLIYLLLYLFFYP